MLAGRGDRSRGVGVLPEARTGEAEGVSVVMGTFLVQDSRCFCIGLPSVLNEIAALL